MFSSDKLEVFVRKDGERGVRAKTAFRPGQFVCELEANLLSKDQFAEAEKEYEKEQVPVYALEVRDRVILLLYFLTQLHGRPTVTSFTPHIEPTLWGNTLTMQQWGQI